MRSDAAHGGDGPDEDREPDAVDALGEGGAQVSGAEVARDARSGAVGEEDAEADHRLEDHRRDAEAGELGGAEVTHDGGVGEQEERLGDEGEERRDREAQDLPVDGLHAAQGRSASARASERTRSPPKGGPTHPDGA